MGNKVEGQKPMVFKPVVVKPVKLPGDMTELAKAKKAAIIAVEKLFEDDNKNPIVDLLGSDSVKVSSSK
jgi:hypothetical protein